MFYRDYIFRINVVSKRVSYISEVRYKMFRCSRTFLVIPLFPLHSLSNHLFHCTRRSEPGPGHCNREKNMLLLWWFFLYGYFFFMMRFSFGSFFSRVLGCTEVQLQGGFSFSAGEAEEGEGRGRQGRKRSAHAWNRSRVARCWELKHFLHCYVCMEHGNYCIVYVYVYTACIVYGTRT